MNPAKSILLASTFILLGACAHTAPAELLSARTTYDRAAAGPAKQYTPADLHIAKESLARAEKSYTNDGDTVLVRDQAYIAQRKSELAEVLARIEMLRKGIAASDQQEDALTKQDAAKTKAELARTKGALTAEKAQGAATEKELAIEKERRADAEKRAAQSAADLARIGAVKQDERGTVITLSGSVLFASNKFELLPAAQVKIGQVAEAATNQTLSVNRANSVRDYLVGHGIAADRITAAGFGSDRTIADNKSAEGRANNRRVEIVVKAGPR